MLDNLAVYHLNERICERGFQFDSQLAEAAKLFLKKAKDKTDSELAERTASTITAATQAKRLLKYLQEKHKVAIGSMRAAEVREWLEHDDLDPEVRFLLETRLEAAKSSGSKYTRGLSMVGRRGRMRHTIQFGGAGRTGRFSGKGFQPHNMSRPTMTVRKADGTMAIIGVDATYIDEVIIPGIYSNRALGNDFVYGGPNEAGALALRHSIRAALGNELVVADWSNIESRILAWIAGQNWKLDAYRTGADLYKILAAQSLGIDVSEVDDQLRQAFKVVELACGFGGGVGALVTMAAAYQLDLDSLATAVMPRATNDQQRKAKKAWRRAFLTGEDYGLEPPVYMACDILKQSYRESNDCINQFRYDLDNAIKDVVEHPENCHHVGKCLVFYAGQWLVIQLPSGRRLLYANPKIHREELKDPDTGAPIYRKSLSYMTARGKQWRREKSWAGLFVENIVQAIACDVLRGALLRLDADTLSVPAIYSYLQTLPEWERTAISLHVHDEVALDVPIGSYPLKRMIVVMCAGESWCPGLPLNAEGWTNPIYGKRKAQKLH